MQISSSIENNRTFFQKKLRPDISFDVVDRNLMIGGRDACLYCIDGFTKDDTLLKVLQAMSSIETAQMPDNANDFAALYLAYGEIGLETDSDALIIQLLSGVPFLLIDGYAQALTIDCRTYPARGVSEPEKDKVLRGSRDGFVETLVFNTALIRRRIRDPKLRMEIMNIGESSHTDIAICYMENRVDTELLNRIRTRIQKVHVDALSMNQESLAECIYPHKWFNPFPKFRFSERPDTSAASILEGNIIILVDNSPSAMILPSSVFDIIEEADDYYFPPLTGTYLRLSRTVIFFLTLFLTPLWLLFMQNPGWIPEWLAFIRVTDEIHVALIYQLLILEFAIDGLRLAAVNTPSMLTLSQRRRQTKGKALPVPKRSEKPRRIWTPRSQRSALLLPRHLRMQILKRSTKPEAPLCRLRRSELAERKCKSSSKSACVFPARSRSLIDR